MPNPISVIQGLVIKGNVLINRHLDPKYPMSLGISPCLGTGLPCDQPTVRPAVLHVLHPDSLHPEAVTARTTFIHGCCAMVVLKPPLKEPTNSPFAPCCTSVPLH